ncbi:MAG: SDR family NAD(P)-dependent oxidoreductase [Burkholderiaceae bacterium]
MEFKDQTVMLSGASGNLGRALAAQFAEQGARLVLLGRSASHLDHVFGLPTPLRLHLACDLMDPQQTQATVDQALQHCKRIHVLANCAGGFAMGPAVHETSDASWDAMMELNCKTLLHLSRSVLPNMLESGGGKIINVAAFSALKGTARMAAYGAAKAAVIRLTESMAAELRGKNINVNCVLPTILDTLQNRQSMPQADPANWVQPAALAQVMLFLASNAAQAIHGAAIPVTGLS